MGSETAEGVAGTLLVPRRGETRLAAGVHGLDEAAHGGVGVGLGRRHGKVDLSPPRGLGGGVGETAAGGAAVARGRGVDLRLGLELELGLESGRRWPGAEVSTYSAASRRQEGFGKTKRIRSGVGPLAWQGW